MKNKIKSLLALVMAICMLFAIAGCGDKGKDTSSEQTVSNDDFFTDSETENTSSTDTQSTASTDKKQSKNTNKGDNGQTGTVTTQTVPKENQIGGKSWKDVLASMPKKLRGTKLVMYNWNPATEYTGAPAVMDAFTKQTGIRVEWRTISHAVYFTKLPAIIASGENIPDLARIGYAGISFLKNFQPLSVTKYNFKDEAWDDSMMKILTVKGKAYGTTLKNTHCSGPNLLFYNKSIIEKEDYEDPYKLWKAGKWTWKKYLKMATQAVDDGYFVASTGEQMMPGYAESWNVVGTSFNGTKFTTNWNTKKFLNVYEELGDLFHGSKGKQKFGYGQEESFNAGQNPFYLGTGVHARNKNAYFSNLKANGTLYFVPVPEHEELKGKYYQGFGEIECYGVPKGASNPEAVPYFLRYFMDGANYALDTYFGNKQNLEVYNWCMNQTKVVDYGFGPDGVAGGYGGSEGIHKYTGAQMKTYIDSVMGKVNKYVKELNDELKNFK